MMKDAKQPKRTYIKSYPYAANGDLNNLSAQPVSSGYEMEGAMPNGSVTEGQYASTVNPAPHLKYLRIELTNWPLGR